MAEDTLPFNIADLEKGKFTKIEDNVYAIRVTQTDETNLFEKETNLIISLLNSVVEQQKLTNLYLSQIVDDELEV